jgi:hypothetical protein
MFASFRRTAFRLETLPAYSVAEEQEAFTAWREGKAPPAWLRNRKWLSMVADATAAGKSMQRVRVVRRPLSDYIRFELEWGYPSNIGAGEDIRILELRDDVAELPDHDFWLFDDAVAVRMDYDDEGRFLRPVEVSDAEPYRRGRDIALRRAVPLENWKRAQPFDMDAYLRESTGKSGVPLKVEDSDVLRDATAMLLAMRAKSQKEDGPSSRRPH